ncbi:hypothetical protein M3P05_16040 [Sansalvadorimonas sp. 2012CJ34-2]|uniref:Uncharacterized protein n=1 Tax=Parendozoicomonas callyspongiae TaxID=2942213 RepID=A0ABT0PL21_9GAMM|nr:hypothetical protein [Sansalvadorimonas sp. 2012CJ34-2]MCL6271432.1 hypothetical protein [Sansalvadorimonas sp. 2012CJ34-2]
MTNPSEQSQAASLMSGYTQNVMSFIRENCDGWLSPRPPWKTVYLQTST